MMPKARPAKKKRALAALLSDKTFPRNYPAAAGISTPRPRATA